MLDKLKPTERTVLLALKVKPAQTVSEIAAIAGISRRHHAMDAIRVLLTAGMLTQDTTLTPYTFSLAPEPVKVANV